MVAAAVCSRHRAEHTWGYHSYVNCDWLESMWTGLADTIIHVSFFRGCRSKTYSDIICVTLHANWVNVRSSSVNNNLFLEIVKVRSVLFQNNNRPLELPSPAGKTVTLSKKVFVPAKEYPDVSLCCCYFAITDTRQKYLIISPVYTLVN